ncbi:putative RNA methyltransferase [Paenibacillus ehimensis]|uniref:putative RNA methyltransferase n=1 Tax=Paenibacillus ehimensis TaxID=79264 RepID=UPI000FDCB62A|nr:methyltransferase domain-containing protein [Paenibacillus ehimensis]
MLKKIDAAARLIGRHSSLFQCPVCGLAMEMNENRTLLCRNRHGFDTAKPGYISLLTKSVKSDYGKAMFEARNLVCRSGFFHPLIGQIGKLILNGRTEPVTVLDAGCGEGSPLAQLADVWKRGTSAGFLGIGLDLSKEGVAIAAREYAGFLWCVGDLARSPFRDRSFDVILNVLSASNYGEFRRLLRKDGILIKVIPGSGHLRQLRHALYDRSPKQAYSNDKTRALFLRHFDMLDERQIRYDVALQEEQLEPLVRMTPLSWGARDEQIQRVLRLAIREVTADFTVLVGRAKVR